MRSGNCLYCRRHQSEILKLLFKHGGFFFELLDRFCIKLCTYSLCAEGSCALLFVVVILPHHICNILKKLHGNTWKWEKNIRRRNDVFLWCMEEVQAVQVYRSDNEFSSLDGRTPSTEGLKCKTVWRFCLLWLWQSVCPVYTNFCSTFELLL